MGGNNFGHYNQLRMAKKLKQTFKTESLLKILVLGNEKYLLINLIMLKLFLTKQREVEK